MLFLKLCIFFLLAAGFYFLAADILRVPSHAVSKAAYSVTQKDRAVLSLEVLQFQLAARLSPLIRLSESKKRELSLTLKMAEIPLTPETYIARILVKALSWNIPGLLAGLITPILTGVFFLYSILWLTDNLKSASKIVRRKRENIDHELPRFVATIAQRLQDSNDVLSMMEDYMISAGKEFKRELEITVADMRSGSQITALIRMGARVGSFMLSQVVRGLISVINGDNSIIQFRMLQHDFNELERQQLKLTAAKRPAKIKKFSYIIMICFVIIILYVMMMQILQTFQSF